MRTLLLLLLIAGCTFSHAQNAPVTNNNVLSFEIGKTGLVYNIGFDHRFSNRPFGFRAVAGGVFAKYTAASVVGAGGYYLLGKERKFLELGADVQRLHVEENSDDQRSAVFFYPDYETDAWYPSLNIGYRGYWRKGMFRIGFSPGVIDGKFIPGGYISIGAAF